MSDERSLSRSFTKLDSGIIYSSIWPQSDAVLRVWIAFLALADADGYVRVSIPALAQLCHKGIEETELIVKQFESPDKYSRIRDYDGRKLKPIESGGWLILNYARYRLAGTKSHAERQKRYRQNHPEYDKTVTKVTHRDAHRDVTASHRDSPSASASSSVQEKKRGVKGRKEKQIPLLRPTMDEVETFVEKELQCPRKDGRMEYLKWEEKGWPENWKNNLRRFKEGGWLHSQKQPQPKKKIEYDL